MVEDVLVNRNMRFSLEIVDEVLRKLRMKLRKYYCCFHTDGIMCPLCLCLVDSVSALSARRQTLSVPVHGRLQFLLISGLTSLKHLCM